MHHLAGDKVTWDAGDAKNVGIADRELIHHRGRLVGINNHNFAGCQSAGEDPHAAGCGIHFMKLFGLYKS